MMTKKNQTGDGLSGETTKLSSGIAALEAQVASLQQVVENRELAISVVDRVARIITSTLDINDVYEKFALELSKLVTFDRAQINLIDERADTYTIEYLFGEEVPGRYPGAVRPLTGSRTGQAVAAKVSVVQDDIGPDPERQYRGDQAYLQSKLLSSIVTPLIARGRIAGTLSLRSERVSNFGPREKVIIERLANQIAPAFENARLYRESVREKACLELVLRNSSSIAAHVDQDLRYTWMYNPHPDFVAEDILGKRDDELSSSEGISALMAFKGQVLESGVGDTQELSFALSEGSRIYDVSAEPTRDASGRVNGLTTVAVDITDRKRTEILETEHQRQIEQRAFRSQKLESVGRLAGGVAHEFNNALGAITGFCSLAMQQTRPGTTLNDYLGYIQSASNRASVLTQQLLTFSRERPSQAVAVDLNDIIIKLEGLIQHLVGEGIELVVRPESDLGLVQGDYSLLEQVVMNLVINARDAMPNGGKLTIRTNHQPYCGGISSDGFAVLTVADTGVGMTEEVKARIFEPFFTTKEVGQGTGLGLATCYGIVSGMRGHIDLESSPGQGSEFQVYLPISYANPQPEPTDEGYSDNGPSSGLTPERTILLVEDDTIVRKLASSVLRGKGYAVLEAGNGVEALGFLATNLDEAIDLLVTDVVMPEIGGEELAARLSSDCPGLKILFTSGYLQEGQTLGNKLGSPASFLRKPFLPDQLLAQVAELLSN